MRSSFLYIINEGLHATAKLSGYGKNFSGFSLSVSSPINGVLLMVVILLKLLLLCMTSFAVKHIA